MVSRGPMFHVVEPTDATPTECVTDPRAHTPGEAPRGEMCPVVLATEAMGTRFEAVLLGQDESRLRAAAEAAFDEIHELHDRLSAFASTSVIGRLNEHAAFEPVRVAGDVFVLLRVCRDLWEATEGMFDPTVAGLMRLWGFRQGDGEAWGPPTDAEVEAALALVGMDRVGLDERDWSVRFSQPGVRLDLGSIAKGYALDAAATILRDRGVDCGLIHGGTSSVVTIGAPAGTAGWAVEVRSPLPHAPSRVVSLCDESLSISAPHGREVVVHGRRLGHVIDPRTGRPVQGASLAAVISSSGALADAWSTAALVVGAQPTMLPEGMRAMVLSRDGVWEG